MKYFSQALLNFLADTGLIAAIVGLIGCFFTYVFKNAGEEVFLNKKIKPAVPWFVNLLFNLGFTFLLISTASIMADTAALQALTKVKNDIPTTIYYITEIWIFSFILSILLYVTVIKSFNIGKDIWINYVKEKKVKSDIKLIESEIQLAKNTQLLREILKEQLLLQDTFSDIAVTDLDDCK